MIFEHLNESIQERMNRQAIDDLVRGTIRGVILGKEDNDFLEIPYSDWIHRYTRKGNKPWSYDEWSFQIDLLNDPAHRLVVKKAAQMGVSDTMARKCIAMLCRYDRTKALYTLPTDPLAGTFSDTRVRPIFEDSYSISRWMGKGSTDSLGRKQVKDSFMIIQGGWDVRIMQMMDIDFLFIDELDRQKQEIIGSMRTRMDASIHRYEFDYSTPTVEGFGIDALYEETDKKEWFLTCPRCGLEQYMEYDHIMFKPEDEEHYDPFFGCKQCKQELNRYAGVWKPTTKCRPDLSGYHITQAMSPRQTAFEILDKRTNGQYLLESDYWNYVWGMAAKSSLEGTFGEIKWNSLYGTHELQPFCHSQNRVIIMSVDWGLPWSWAEVREIDFEARQSKIIWLEAFESQNPDDHPARMIDIARQSGASMVVADIGYSDGRGYKLKNALGDLFWDVSSNSTGLIEPRFDRKKHRITCFKERIIKRHFVLISDGRIVLPINSDQIKIGKDYKARTQVWIDHHRNIKIRKDKDGNEEIVSNQKPTHMVFSSAYGDLAFEYLSKAYAAERRHRRREIRVHVVGGRTDG